MSGGGVKVTFLPDGKSVQVRAGTTVLDASRRARVNIRTRCGGLAACLMCKVEVSEDQASGLAAPGPAECNKLGPLLEQGVRLSCQAKVRADVAVTVPEDPLKAAVRRQLERQRADDDWA